MTSSLPDTRARLDTAKNRKLLGVSLALASVGLGLVGLGLVRDWGFVPVFWSGVLAVIGLGWIVGLRKGGGMAKAACPHCGAAMRFTHIQSARTQQCEACHEWSAGTANMAPLAPDHLATEAVFTTPLPPDALRWPTTATGSRRCPVCAEPATRMIEVQATHALGDAFAALSPISLQRVHELRVPACAAHDDGMLLDTDENDQGLVVSFRSYAYYLEFVALNRRDPSHLDSDQAAPQPNAPALDDNPEPIADPITLAAFLVDNPRPVDVRAPLTCPRHQVPVLTAMGWVSTMDFLPSHEWLEQTADNPVCLDIGKHIQGPPRGSHVRERVAWCPACEAGMREAGF